MKQMRYRFSLIINELKTCEMTPYKTTLMAFINCILCAIVDLIERTRIRNEFIGWFYGFIKLKSVILAYFTLLSSRLLSHLLYNCCYYDNNLIERTHIRNKFIGRFLWFHKKICVRLVFSVT